MAFDHPFNCPVKDTCTECNQLVMIPPGMYYMNDPDQPMHSGCADLRARIDFSEEVMGPEYDEIESMLDDAFSDMKEDA